MIERDGHKYVNIDHLKITVDSLVRTLDHHISEIENAEPPGSMNRVQKMLWKKIGPAYLSQTLNIIRELRDGLYTAFKVINE